MGKVCKTLSRLLLCVIAAAATGLSAMYALLPSEMSVEAGSANSSCWLGTELHAF